MDATQLKLPNSLHSTRARMTWMPIWEDLNSMLKFRSGLRRTGQLILALLTGKALETYSRLHPDNLEKYDVLKEALLLRFQLTEDGFRNRFYQSKAEEGETAEQFMTRLTRYLERWMDLAGTKKTYDEL